MNARPPCLGRCFYRVHAIVPELSQASALAELRQVYGSVICIASGTKGNSSCFSTAVNASMKTCCPLLLLWFVHTLIAARPLLAFWKSTAVSAKEGEGFPENKIAPNPAAATDCSICFRSIGCPSANIERAPSSSPPAAAFMCKPHLLVAAAAPQRLLVEVVDPTRVGGTKARACSPADKPATIAMPSFMFTIRAAYPVLAQHLYYVSEEKNARCRNSRSSKWRCLVCAMCAPKQQRSFARGGRT